MVGQLNSSIYLLFFENILYTEQDESHDVVVVFCPVSHCLWAHGLCSIILGCTVCSGLFHIADG